MTKHLLNRARKGLEALEVATMTEIALVTAGIGLCLAIAGILLDRATSIRVERVAQNLRATDDGLVLATKEIRDVTTDLPESRVISVEGTCRALKEQYDGVVNEFEKHRAQCHRTMQRFDQIMRRDERAAKVITDAQEGDGNGLDPEPAEDVGEEEIATQEGDRGFLEKTRPTNKEIAETVVGGSAYGTWDERRRAMSREYWANRGGVPSGPRR